MQDFVLGSGRHPAHSLAEDRRHLLIGKVDIEKARGELKTNYWKVEKIR